MSSKLKEAYRIRESVVDRSKPPSGQNALSYLGINFKEMKNDRDVTEAFNHLHSRLSFAFSALKKKIGYTDPSMKATMSVMGGGRKPLENVDVDKAAEAIDKVLVALQGLKSAKVSSTSASSKSKQPHPASGYADDPNPKTQGRDYPYRGYRSG